MIYKIIDHTVHYCENEIKKLLSERKYISYQFPLHHYVRIKTYTSLEGAISQTLRKLFREEFS